MLRRFYDWCIAAADKPYAVWLMAAMAFAESSVFPIPPDTMLIPMSLARPKRAFVFATLCTVTSVAGGLLARAQMDLPLDEPVRAARRYFALTAAEVRAAFQKWVRPDGFVEVVRGPAPK